MRTRDFVPAFFLVTCFIALLVFLGFQKPTHSVASAGDEKPMARAGGGSTDHGERLALSQFEPRKITNLGPYEMVPNPPYDENDRAKYIAGGGSDGSTCWLSIDDIRFDKDGKGYIRKDATAWRFRRQPDRVLLVRMIRKYTLVDGRTNLETDTDWWRVDVPNRYEFETKPRQEPWPQGEIPINEWWVVR